MRQWSKQFKAFITDAIPNVPITENRKRNQFPPRILSGTMYN